MTFQGIQYTEHMRSWIIGVMGPGIKASEQDRQNAYELGRLIAENGWILLSGGRRIGVMDAVSKGAKKAGGLTIGILPDRNRDGASEALDIAILTNMGSARNVINALTSDVIIACGMETGTASEIALALKEGRPVVILAANEDAKLFFRKLRPELVRLTDTPEEAVREVRQILKTFMS